MELAIVAGLFGVGKSRTVNILEDTGFYCVDDIPSKLTPTFYSLYSQAREEFQHVATVTDTRGGTLLDSLPRALALMREEGEKYKILFLDAGDPVLINHFRETRCKHPLAEGCLGLLKQAVQMERQILKTAQECSNHITDTSFSSPAQFKERISGLFLGDASAALTIYCVFFGFKYGLPPEADLVFDMRCLPNPFYVEKLKRQTSLDEPMRRYVMKRDQTKGFITRFLDMINYVLPSYCDEGKNQLVIAIGYTGGRHHSVALA